jgi:hypothetical protein
MSHTASDSDPPPQEGRVGEDSICLRCDWIGETDSDACPRCEAPLFRLRASTKPFGVTRSSRVPPSPANPPSDTPVEVAQDEDDLAPAVLGVLSRRTWVIVCAVAVAAIWIATTGGPFGRVRAQDVPPTANPQSVAPTANSQDRADTSPGGRSFLGGPDLSGLDLKGVTGDVTSSPARSPNGSRIVFGARGGTIYSVIVQSGKRSVLVHLPGRNLDSVDEIEWAPDGSHIAVMNDLEPGGGRLYVMNADGTDVRVLLDNYEPQSRFVWSPEGKSIAYATRGPAGLRWYAIDVDGAGPPRKIDKSVYLRWEHPGVPIH